jgi:hypothetical protein
MKVVKFMELKDMPRGTVFSEYAPCFVTGLFVKGNTFSCGAEPDMCGFYEQEVLAEHWSDDPNDPPEVQDYGWMRRLRYDDGEDQLFAVYDDMDVARMVNLLTLKGVSDETWKYKS